MTIQYRVAMQLSYAYRGIRYVEVGPALVSSGNLDRAATWRLYIAPSTHWSCRTHACSTAPSRCKTWPWAWTERHPPMTSAPSIGSTISACYATLDGMRHGIPRFLPPSIHPSIHVHSNHQYIHTHRAPSTPSERNSEQRSSHTSISWTRSDSSSTVSTQQPGTGSHWGRPSSSRAGCAPSASHPATSLGMTCERCVHPCILSCRHSCAAPAHVRGSPY